MKKRLEFTWGAAWGLLLGFLVGAVTIAITGWIWWWLVSLTMIGVWLIAMILMKLINRGQG